MLNTSSAINLSNLFQLFYAIFEENVSLCFRKKLKDDMIALILNNYLKKTVKIHENSVYCEKYTYKLPC